MENEAETFPDGWERAWTVNVSRGRAEHIPTGLVVQLRQNDAHQWCSYAQDAVQWVMADPARLGCFFTLLVQAEAIFRERCPETGWLTYVAPPAALPRPAN